MEELHGASLTLHQISDNLWLAQILLCMTSAVGVLGKRLIDAVGN